MPEEIRAAKRLNSDIDRLLASAQEEAAQTTARAQEQAALLIEDRGLADEARRVSARIVQEAEATAGEVRRGADEYAAGVLIRLEGDLVRTLQSIKRGIELLNERTAAGAAGAGSASEREAPEPAAARTGQGERSGRGDDDDAEAADGEDEAGEDVGAADDRDEDRDPRRSRR